MKIRKILSAATAAAITLTLTVCSGDNTTSNPLNTLNSGNSPANSSSSDK